MMKSPHTIAALLLVNAVILGCGDRTAATHRAEATEGILSLDSARSQEQRTTCPQPSSKLGLTSNRERVTFNFPDGAYSESRVFGERLAFAPDISNQRRRLMLDTPVLLFPVLIDGQSTLETSSKARGLSVSGEMYGLILGRAPLSPSILAENRGKISSFVLVGLDSITPRTIASMTQLTQAESALSLCDSTPLTDAIGAQMSETLVALHLRDCAGLNKATSLEKIRRLETLVVRETNLDDRGLNQLASGASLRALDLTNTSITDDGLVALSGLEQLRALDLSNNEQITDRGMAALRSLPNLETLDVTKTQVSDQGLELLSSDVRLRTLVMDNPQDWSRLSSAGLFNGLRSLEVVGGRVGREEAEALATACQLESLTFREVNVDGESLTLLATLPALRSLRFESSRVSNELFSNIASWPALDELKIISTQIEGSLPAHLELPEKLDSLQWLDAYQGPEQIIATLSKVNLSRLEVEAENRGALFVGGDWRVAESRRIALCPLEILGPHCEQLSCTKNAESISLCSLEGPSSFYAPLMDNDNLEELFIGWMEADDDRLDLLTRQSACTGLVLEHSNLSPVGYSLISRLHRLRGLSLAGTSFDDRAASVLSELPDLQLLNLGNTRISGRALTNIGDSEGLIGLDLRGTKMNSAGLAAMNRMTSLRSLDLSKTSISRAGLERLSKLPALRALRLAFTPIGDEAAGTLVKMRGLVALDLANTRVTDQILAHLARLPELRILGLEGTKVSLEAIRAFRRQNPRVEVLELQSE